MGKRLSVNFWVQDVVKRPAFFLQRMSTKKRAKTRKNEKKCTFFRKNEKKSHFFTKKFAYMKKKYYLCTEIKN